jgi:hypothetical protein
VGADCSSWGLNILCHDKILLPGYCPVPGPKLRFGGVTLMIFFESWFDDDPEDNFTYVFDVNEFMRSCASETPGSQTSDRLYRREPHEA